MFQAFLRCLLIVGKALATPDYQLLNIESSNLMGDNLIFQVYDEMLAISQLIGDNRKFNLWDIFWGVLLIVGKDSFRNLKIHHYYLQQLFI